MSDRTVEDRLREEYSSALPDLLRICEHLKAQIHYLLLPTISRLSSFESIVVKSRVKEGKSAIDALRRRGVGGAFDRDTPERYSLLFLRDLVGVRVLAFPSNRVIEVDQILRSHFSSWTADSVMDKETGKTLAFKYYGLCLEASRTVVCEYQVASMLTGLFWEAEHSAIYKPAPKLKGIARSLTMQDRSSKVYGALKAFEDEFERLTSKKDA